MPATGLTQLSIQHTGHFGLAQPSDPQMSPYFELTNTHNISHKHNKHQSPLTRPNQKSQDEQKRHEVDEKQNISQIILRELVFKYSDDDFGKTQTATNPPNNYPDILEMSSDLWSGGITI